MLIHPSRSNRFWCSSIRPRQDSQPDALLHPERVHPPGTDPVRSHRLHDIGPYHPQHSRGTVFDRPSELVDQDFCHGGRLLIPDPGYCCGIDGHWRQCESGAESCYCWSGNPGGDVCPVYYYCRDLPDANAPTRQAFDHDLPWKQHLYTLYTVSLLIMARSIFRVVEYAMGQDGSPLTHEWTLYVFDALLMFVVMVIYGVFFPSQLQLRRQKTEGSHIGLEDSEERL